MTRYVPDSPGHWDKSIPALFDFNAWPAHGGKWDERKDSNTNALINADRCIRRDNLVRYHRKGCSSGKKCGYGEGSCSRDSDCMSGLKCLDRS